MTIILAIFLLSCNSELKYNVDELEKIQGEQDQEKTEEIVKENPNQSEGEISTQGEDIELNISYDDATVKIESKIDGDFEGFDGDTIIKLMNGQIWQQNEYYYEYMYAFMPNVIIFKDGSKYKMIVEGIDSAVGVTELTTNVNPSSPNNIDISSFMGGIVIADDGTYLGTISNKYDSDSIANKYGDYGSKYSSDSIMNKYGDYGSKYSIYSPFNKYTSTPPKIYLNEKFIGYLTINNYLTPNVDPVILIAILTK